MNNIQTVSPGNQPGFPKAGAAKTAGKSSSDEDVFALPQKQQGAKKSLDNERPGGSTDSELSLLNITNVDQLEQIDIGNLPIVELPQNIHLDDIGDLSLSQEFSPIIEDVETSIPADFLAGVAMADTATRKFEIQLSSQNTEIISSVELPTEDDGQTAQRSGIDNAGIGITPLITTEAGAEKNVTSTLIVQPAKGAVTEAAQVQTGSSQKTDLVMAQVSQSDIGRNPDSQSQQSNDRGAKGDANLVDKIGQKIEGVEVVEAKTFTPLASQLTNRNNIVDALVRMRDVSGGQSIQITEPIYDAPQTKTLSTLKIQLTPHDLGTVTAVMKLSGEELQVQLKVENMDAYRRLTEDSSAITKALKGHGFGIDQISVQFSAAGDRGQMAQGQQQNGQSFQSQAGSENAMNFNESGEGRHSFGSSEKNGGHADELESQQQAQARETQVLSDGVYL